jgi:transposase
MHRLPEAWLAPPQVRELRELVRYRAKLVALRSGLKAQVHAVLATQGVRVPMSDLFGVAGTRLLDQLHLGRAYALRIASLRRLLVAYDQEVAMLGREIAAALAGDVGYLAIQTIPGVGPVLAGRLRGRDRQRGPLRRRPAAVLLGRTHPRHHESDTTVRRGPITKQGPRLVRWAAVEATGRLPGGSKQAAWFHRIADRRGTGITPRRGRPQAPDPGLLRPARRQVRCLAPAPRQAT